jgi:hypothetical protein
MVEIGQYRLWEDTCFGTHHNRLIHLGVVLEPHDHAQVELEASLLVPDFAFGTLVFVFVASWSSTTNRMLSGLLFGGGKFSYASNTSIVTQHLGGTDDLPRRSSDSPWAAASAAVVFFSLGRPPPTLLAAWIREVGEAWLRGKIESRW